MREYRQQAVALLRHLVPLSICGLLLNQTIGQQPVAQIQTARDIPDKIVSSILGCARNTLVDRTVRSLDRLPNASGRPPPIPPFFDDRPVIRQYPNKGREVQCWRQSPSGFGPSGHDF